MQEPKSQVIAVDLMGGDHAPGAAVDGCVRALEDGHQVLALGSEKAVEALTARGPFPSLKTKVCDQVISAAEAPLQAIKDKPGSTIAVGLSLLSRGAVGAFVSAGSTGALVAGGVVMVGRAPGVDKPCLGAVFPSADGRGVFVCDLGATSEARPRTLVQFAVMAKAAVESVLGRRDPKVYLLNIGTEAEKGSLLTKKAFGMLQDAPVQFCGNIEARDVLSGSADAVITDGFTGNVFLKTCEGVSEFQMTVLKKEAEVGLGPEERAKLFPLLKRTGAALDYANYGGAMLLGLKGCIVKCHGASSSEAMHRGIERAALFVKHRAAETIVDVLSKMSDI